MLLTPSYENQISRQEPSYEPAWVWGPQLAIHYCDACDRRKDQLGVAGGGGARQGLDPPPLGKSRGRPAGSSEEAESGTCTRS